MCESGWRNEIPDILLVDDGHTFSIDDHHHLYSLITITMISFADFITLILFFHPTLIIISQLLIHALYYKVTLMVQLKLHWFSF